MAEITKREGNYITIEHTFDLRGDMLEIGRKYNDGK